MNRYILEGGKPVAVSLDTWAEWIEHLPNRRLAEDWVGPSHVSTVFLGIDHNFSKEGPPVLWETMIFGGPRNGECHRYASQASAQMNHDRIVNELNGNYE